MQPCFVVLNFNIYNLFLSATCVIWYISFMDFKASVATKSVVRIKLESDFSLLSGLILSHTFGGAHVH